MVHFTNDSSERGAREYHPGDELGFGGEPSKVKFANTSRMWAPVEVQDKKSSRYDRLIKQAADKYRLPPALVKAVTATESGFNPQAHSHAGACGLMQLMPATAAEMEVADIYDPEQNINGGARYLRYLINAFDGDVKLAVAAYNAGPNLVSKLGRVPNIPETRGYVKRVLSLYKSYRKADMLAQR